MRDIDVRRAVKSALIAQHEGDLDTRIVEEMGIWNGSVRIDLAVVNGELAGYELKSARDTLERLPNQCALYSQVFDRVVLVAADRHLGSAPEKIPEWWGIIRAHGLDDCVELETLREPAINPSVDPVQLARLLWREEVIAFLERENRGRGFRNATREKLAVHIAETTDIARLTAYVRRCLKDRPARSGEAVDY